MTSRRSAPSQERVGEMFDRVVGHYDLVNTLLSMGLDRRWRQAAASNVPSASGDLVLDLGCGTGKLGALFSPRATAVGVDVSERMLLAARGRIHDRVLASAFRLPFADSSFKGAVSAFVLRNLDDLAQALRELARVVAPAGAVALVDITGPSSHWSRRAFDAYFKTMAPAFGRLSGDVSAYRYLANSLAQLPPAAEVGSMLEEAGFEFCGITPLSLGFVTLWTGVRAA